MTQKAAVTDLSRLAYPDGTLVEDGDIVAKDWYDGEGGEIELEGVLELRDSCFRVHAIFGEPGHSRAISARTAADLRFVRRG